MKKWILVIVLCLGVNYINAQAYTTDVPISAAFDSTYIVGFATIDSFDIGMHTGYTQGQFLVCENSTFIFKGNQSSSMPAFYLMPGSKLILKDSYFYPTIYMSTMSELDAQGGSQNLFVHRMNTATMTDTANANFLKDSIYTAMNFTFTNWPGAVSPCSLAPNALNDLDELNANISVQNGRLHYTLNSNTQMDLSIYDLNGHKLVSEFIFSKGNLDVSQLAVGVYIINIRQGSKVLRNKILIN